MTSELDEAMAAVAQGVLNIREGLTTIEHGSLIYGGMAKLCTLNPSAMIADLKAQNRRYRKALEKIRAFAEGDDWFEMNGVAVRTHLSELTRATLDRKEKSK